MAEVDPPDWLDELDLHVGPPDASVGTRVLDPDRWFLVDEAWAPQRAEAAALLAGARDEVLVVGDDPRLAPAASEVHDLVVRWLADRGLPAVSLTPADRDDAGTVLAATRRQVADDVCLLLPGASGWVLAGGCVCFPSYWRLAALAGDPLGAVHARVPGYPGPMAGRVDGFLGRLRPGQGVWRRNWLVHDIPDLHLPRWVTSVDRPTPVPEGRWLRSERQTLVPLSTTDAVVFTIRTQQVPMTVLAGRPDFAHRLAAAMRGWSAEQRSYKGSAVDEDLLAWLEAV